MHTALGSPYKPTTTNKSKVAPGLNPVAQQVFDVLSPHSGLFSEHSVYKIVNNIAFLIAYTAGSTVRAEQVSVNVIDILGSDNLVLGHKATVCIYYGRGEFTVVFCHQVPHGRELLSGLTEKFDNAIKEILDNEGNTGYGDFKIYDVAV